jgi:hypothetical protein
MPIVSTVTVEPGEQAQRRFPAVDPEPPPRPLWRRLLAPAAVIVLAGAVAAGVMLWPFASGRPGAAGRPDAAVGSGGRVVALTATGDLATADPDGANVTAVSALGTVGQVASASPDGRYLSLGNGQVAIVRQGSALAPYPTKVPVSDGSTEVAWPDSFADGERDLIVLAAYSGYASAINPISVVSLATGRSLSLGSGDMAEGDPQAPGAFLSVAAPPRASAAVSQLIPDSKIELRDSGRPTVVLATAAALNHDAGQSQPLPVQLIPYPDPSGDKIAVVVEPASGSQQAGIVVLSRTGRLIGAVNGSLAVQGVPAWSPSGRTLAYVSSGSGGLALRVWTVGGATLTRSLPATGAGDDWCVWSPDGASVLCGDSASSTPSQDWAIARATGGAMASVRGPGLPIAWLP